ncbi:MAG: DUF3570 domain-containing protein [Betaproteobacteria bacterium]
MAATDRKLRVASPLLAAALALPGILPATVLAQAAPDQGLLQLQYLNYRDWQPGKNRMSVQAPSIYALVPLSDTWVAEGSIVYDAISGASPKFFNTLSQATIGDYRTAGTLKLTKYMGSYAISVDGAVSSEQDFLSRAAGAQVQLFSDDRNRTWTLGVAGTSDRINSDNGIAYNEGRNTVDFLVGVTQILNKNAIIQSNLTYSTGHGYYNDPYKSLDTRPSTRDITAWLTRYNQYFPDPDGTLKLAYRLLYDSFGSTSNMLEVSWVQSLPYAWTVTPALRYYTQSAAKFYKNPPWPKGYVDGENYSADTRLAAFGAFTGGITVAKLLGDGWTIALRADYYQQNPSWRLGGDGSPGIQTFSARWLQVDLLKTF